MTGNSIIRLQNVDIYQQTHLVLSTVNLHIDKGDFVWLIGQTGSGKSSLLKVIYGDLNISTGNGLACGYDLNNIKDKDIPFLRRKLGIVFQDFQLLTDRSVEANLQFVMRATGWTDKKLIADKALDVLEKVGLRSKLKKMPHELSGGEQQRVVIARAMINDPEIILADEPTGNLDDDNARKIAELLSRTCRERGKTLILVTHDRQIIRPVNRVFDMRDGSLTMIESALSS